MLYISSRIRNDMITVYAAQASFYVMISAVPFVMLLLSVSRFFVPIGYDEIFFAVKGVLPVKLHSLAETIMRELFYKSAVPVISLTAATSLWSASRGVAAVERGVRRVYGLNNTPGFFKTAAISLVRTVAFMALLLAALVVLVFGGSIVNMLAEKSVVFAQLEEMLERLSNIAAPIVFCVFFAFVYRSLSGRKARFSGQLFGAVFATVGWLGFSFGFSVYIENFSNYSYVYGSLAVIVLTMLWLYSCMIIFLLGAEVNVIIAKLRGKDWV